MGITEEDIVGILKDFDENDQSWYSIRQKTHEVAVSF